MEDFTIFDNKNLKITIPINVIEIYPFNFIAIDPQVIILLLCKLLLAGIDPINPWT